ncbi:hypothetical protein C8R44DRAFT_822077, partial [Mycena epipterygia]
MRSAGEASSSSLIATLLTASLRLSISSSLTLAIRHTCSPLHSRQCLPPVIFSASSCTDRAFTSPQTRPAASSSSGLQLRRISRQR